MTMYFVHHVIEDPGWTNRDVRVRGSVAVRDLIESGSRGGKRKCRQSCCARCIRDLGQFPDKGQVLRTVPFVAIQVSEGGVIGERGREGMFPVEARNRRILRSRG